MIPCHPDQTIEQFGGAEGRWQLLEEAGMKMSSGIRTHCTWMYRIWKDITGARGLPDVAPQNPHMPPEVQ